MKRAPLLVLAALVAGCTAEVREVDLIRPLSGGGLTAQAIAAAAPAYTLAEHRCPRGARPCWWWPARAIAT